MVLTSSVSAGRAASFTWPPSFLPCFGANNVEKTISFTVEASRPDAQYPRDLEKE